MRMCLHITGTYCLCFVITFEDSILNCDLAVEKLLSMKEKIFLVFVVVYFYKSATLHRKMVIGVIAKFVHASMFTKHT